MVSTTRYVRRGTYLGQIFRPGAGGQTDFPRYVGIVAKASPLKLFRNAALRRSYLTDSSVSFNPLTFTAALTSPAIPDKTKARLHFADQTSVDVERWNFTESSPGSGIFNQIVIDPAVFNPTASYLLDYQTNDRDLLDEIPVTDLRQVLSVGDQEDQRLYQNGRDFRFTNSLVGPTSAGTNAVLTPTITTPAFTGTGTMTVAVGSSASYTHAYNRDYTVTVVSTAPTVVRIDCVPTSSGRNARPGRSTALQNAISVTLPVDTLNTAVEFGITLAFSTVAGAVVNDSWTFSALGAGFLELADANVNTNQFADTTSVTFTGGGVGRVAVNPQTDYTGAENRYLELEVMASGGVAPNRTATLRVRTAGALPFTTYSFNLVEGTPASFNKVLVESGIYLDFVFDNTGGGGNYTIGDTFVFSARCARLDYTGMEDRAYAFQVTTINQPASSVTMSYSCNVAGGGFGSVVFTDNVALQLNNNVRVFARNLTTPTIPTFRYAASDDFTLSENFDGEFDWTLQRQVTESIQATDVLTDLTGAITGTVGAFYVRLVNAPLTVVFVRNASTLAGITYNTVTGTDVIWFASNPGVNIEVKYRHRGIEPDPGSVYFLSGYIKRPQSDYDKPQLFTTRETAADFVAPMTIDNDAAIANQVAWDQNEQALPGVVFMLVQDPDGDGVYTDADYRRAIAVSEINSLPTDNVLVNRFGLRNDMKNSDINMNDPYAARERVAYLGFPVNTPIGDEFTVGSRIYVARKEWQVFVDSPARGTLVAIANNYAKKTITLADGTATQVTLDGSFLAIAAAARTASFSDPAAILLGLPVAGFDEIEELNERQLEQVQGAGMIGLLVQGASAEYDETITTDSTEPSTTELSGTVQRQYTVRRIRARANQKVIGLVPPSAEAGILSVRSFIVEELVAMVTEGIHAPYTDDNGASRPIDPQSDVEVIRMPNLTDYALKFWWNNRYGIKRLFGLYSVDRKLFGGQT